jgi:TolB-like protein
VTEAEKPGNFFAELNRRNVFRVAIVYVLVAWVLLQVADVLFPALTLPDWTVRLVAGLLILGFPLAILFAWAFELTPDGLKREKEVPRGQSITGQTARKLNATVVWILLIAVTIFAVDKFVWQAEDSAAPADVAAKTDDRSIAVLPFANMSDDPANEYFSDGISEELLNLLAKVPELRVIGRTSSFQFKNKNEDLRVIGEKLGVSNILEGSVRKSGNTVRVTAQLISASDGAHLWSDTFDRDLDDIFKVQDEIATSVVETLKVKLLGQAVPQRAVPSTSEAYDLFLRGRYFYLQLGAEQLEKARDYFAQALDLDPNLALAWDGMGAVYVRQILNGTLPIESGHRMATDALAKALELDPLMASAHYRIGFMRMLLDWDWAGAEQAYKEALAIEPNYASALSGLGLLSSALGRLDDAIDYQQRSLDVDPLRAASHHNLGFVHYLNRQFPLAEANFRDALEMSHGSYPRGHYYLALILLAQGRLEEAYAAIEQETGEQFRLAGIAVVAHALGRTEESGAALRELTDTMPDRAAMLIAMAHAYRGESDLAFTWLDRAYEQHDPLIPWITSSPLLDNLKSDSRFGEFAARVKLNL